MSRRRVVITGLGTVNPLAHDVGAFWKALLAGASGIGPITQFDTSAFRVHFGGEVKNHSLDGHLDPKAARRLDRFAQFAMLASIEAMNDGGLDVAKEDPYRCGVILGSGIGGLNEYEEQHSTYLERGPSRISPFVIPKMIPNSAAGNVSIHFGMAGPNTAVSTACASASNAIADAFRAIQYDSADVMLCGGAEAAITPMGLGGFCASRALSQRNDDPAGASRPFDKERDGFVLSEGAGMAVLEELKDMGMPVPADFPQEEEKQEFSYTFLLHSDAKVPDEARWTSGPSIDGKGTFETREAEPWGGDPPELAPAEARPELHSAVIPASDGGLLRKMKDKVAP